MLIPENAIAFPRGDVVHRRLLRANAFPGEQSNDSMHETQSSTHFFFTATNKDPILRFILRTPGNVRTTG
ncbi:MAG: hypothetical protein ACYT04_90090, partial [Nostoc sp.]